MINIKFEEQKQQTLPNWKSKERQEYEEHLAIEEDIREQDKMLEEEWFTEQFNQAESNYMKRMSKIVAKQSDDDRQDYINQNYLRIMQERKIDEEAARDAAKWEWLGGL